MHKLERKEEVCIYLQTKWLSMYEVQWDVEKSYYNYIYIYSKVSGYSDTLERTWTARRADQSILKEINPEYSLDRLMLILKLLYFGYLMWRANYPEETLMLTEGKTEGNRRRGRQRVRWLDSITHSMDMNLSKFQEMVEDKGDWYATVHGGTNSWPWIIDWKTTSFRCYMKSEKCTCSVESNSLQPHEL